MSISPGQGLAVSPHMLNAAAGRLQGNAVTLEQARDTFNRACAGAENAFGSGSVQDSFNEFFAAWFAALDAQTETMGSTADATQQCAVIYDQVERTVLGYIAPLSVAPSSSPPAAPLPRNVA